MFDLTDLPPGKPRIKMTVYNWTAYVGKVKWTTFECEYDANVWLDQATKKYETEKENGKS